MTIAFVAAAIFAYLSFAYILIPYYHAEPTPPLFHIANSTLYTLIQAAILGIIIPPIFRSDNQYEHIFMQALLLLCVADFALRYHSGFESGTPVTWHAHVWDVSMAAFFVTLLKGDFMFSERDYIKSYISVRTFLTIAISVGILFFLGLLYSIGLLNVGDAFKLTNLLLVVFLIWFISNFISLKLSKQVLMIAHMLFKPGQQFEIENMSKSSHLKFRCVDKLSRIFEIDEILRHYNQLVCKSNDLLDALAEKNKLAAIGQTTAMVAHDVRKPFSVVKSVLDMFDEFKKEPYALEQARESINKSIKHVENMLSDIMDFSREVQLELEPVSIVKLLDYSVRQVAQNYSSADINFEYQIKNTRQPLVDDERLARVFVNILGNGVEAVIDLAKKSRGTIDISVHDNELDFNFVEIIIGNDGPLFDEDDIPNIFESFFTKGKKKGTGLGLASSQKIVALHNGTIEAQNRANGNGVEFVINIPASNIREGADTNLLPGNIRESSFVKPVKKEGEIDKIIKLLLNSGKTFKVLLLEDEALYRASVRNTLKKYEELDRILTLYEVQYVDEALELLRNEKITHAIVDIDLGEMKNGFDFLSEVSDKYPEVSCMVHSNRCLDEDKGKANRLGAKAYVPKPLNIEHLVMFLSGAEICDDKAATSCNSQRKVVLFADDDFIMRVSMESMIKGIDGDLEYHSFESGEGLLEKLKTLGGCNVVLTDQNMGKGMTGLEVVKQIRKSNIPCRLYVVANEPASIFENKAKNAGADGYYNAPLDKWTLESIIQG